jgi:hypothetical protein
MPLLLSPFKTIRFEIDENLINAIDNELKHLDIKMCIDDILKKICDYYVKSNINLSDHKNLEEIKINDCQIKFDSCLHISGKQQEMLFEKIFEEDDFIRDVLPVLIIKNRNIHSHILFMCLNE